MILVTGGAGYIGSHAARALRRQGLEVLIFDDLSRGHREAIPQGCRFEDGDLGRPGDVLRVFQQYPIDAVMHFAGLSLVGESMREPARYYQHNVGEAALLVKTALQHEVDRFIFSSSCSVYGQPQRIPMDEEHPCSPISPYGRSKRTVELLLEDCRRAHGLRYINLRYFNACGASLDGRLGESHQPETHLIPCILQAARRDRPVHIFGNDYDTPDGTCIRDYIHVEDLATGHLVALERLHENDVGECFNLGTGKGLSVLEVIEETRRVTGLAVPSKQAPRRPGDPAMLVCDPSRARRQLSWKPRHSDLTTILQSAWAWENDRRY